MDEYASIGAAFVLIVITAFFVAAEYAIIRVRRTRVEEMVEQNVSGAKAIQIRLIAWTCTFRGRNSELRWHLWAWVGSGNPPWPGC